MASQQNDPPPSHLCKVLKFFPVFEDFLMVFSTNFTPKMYFDLFSMVNNKYSYGGKQT